MSSALFLKKSKDSEIPVFRINNSPTLKRELPLSIIDYLHFFEDELDSTNNVGAALTIVHNNEIVLTRTYGLRNAEKDKAVNEHTVFRLASVSKGFAGVLACILQRDGTILLDDKVTNYLPNFKLRDSINTFDLTVKHTLSHTSGLVPHAFDNLIEDEVPLHKIIDQLVDVEISAPPGILYGYQNVVFSLIDTIVRTKTSLSYPQMLEEKIFSKLHMNDASATVKVFEKKKSNIAYPHGRNGNAYKPLPLNLGYYNISPAAGVNASISDMSKWLLALLGNNSDVLDSTILNGITDPVVVSPLKRRYIRNWDKIDEKYYSLGWRIYLYKGRKIMYHGGYVKGYRAEIAFCPEEKIGIAFLQNSPNRLASICIPQFFNRWFDETESVLTDTVSEATLPEFKFFDDTLY